MAAWSVGASSLAEGRHNHTASLLDDGRILVTGGRSLNTIRATTEVWDAATETVDASGSLATARYMHTATLLPDGRVLVAGGDTTTLGNSTGSIEVWDPAGGSNGAWSAAGTLGVERRLHAAVLLPDGRVVFLGGYRAGAGPPTGVLGSVEIWEAGAVTFHEDVITPRSRHTATLLPDGRILVVGGFGAETSTEIYDPANPDAPAVAGPDLDPGRRWHSATRLDSGDVLVAGGLDNSTAARSSVRIWDHLAEDWLVGPPLTQARAYHRAARLPDGRVLVTGGADASDAPQRLAEIWDPGDPGGWTASSLMNEGRHYHGLVSLPDGRAVVLAGANEDAVVGTIATTTSVEIWVDVGGPTEIAVASAAHATAAGTCTGPVTVETRRAGLAEPAAMDVSLDLSADSPSLTFFADADCTGPVASAVIAVGTTETSFWFVETTSGSPIVTATDAGGPLGEASQAQDVSAGPADTLRLEAETGVAPACGTETIDISLFDAFGNAISDLDGLSYTVTLTASAPSGDPAILATSLGNPSALPAESVQGELDAPTATVEVSLDAAATLSLVWDAPDLGGAATPETVDFQVGAPDPEASTLSVSPTVLAVRTGEALIRVTPRDACELVLGPGRDVEVRAPGGTVGPVDDVGDGTYTASLTAEDCLGNLTISASVDDVTLGTTADVDVTCLSVDTASPVTVDAGIAEACAAGGVFAMATVHPLDEAGVSLPSGQSVTVDEDPPFIVGGPVTEIDDAGAVAYRVAVGSDRCGGPRPITVRINGTALDTRPALVFSCPPVDPAAGTFSAEPSAVVADGETVSIVTVEALDVCGNPAFARDVSFAATHPSLAVSVEAMEASTRDVIGDPSDGTARVSLSSAAAGPTGVEATIDGEVVRSADDLVRFLLDESLDIHYAAATSVAVAGQIVDLHGVLTSRYPGTLTELHIRPVHDGVVQLADEGAELLDDGTLRLDRLGPGETREIRLRVQLSVGAPEASSRLEVAYVAEEALDQEPQVTWSEEVRIVSSDGFDGPGWECGASAGGNGGAAAFLGLLLCVAWLLRAPRGTCR